MHATAESAARPQAAAIASSPSLVICGARLQGAQLLPQVPAEGQLAAQGNAH